MPQGKANRCIQIPTQGEGHGAWFLMVWKSHWKVRNWNHNNHLYMYIYITTILANWCYINNVGLLICCTCWQWMINIFSSWVINYPRLGFTDSWMRFSCRYRGKRMRIDYFIVSEQLKDRITACEMHGQGIELEGASYFILIIPIK